MQALSKDTPTVEHYGTIFVAIELSQRNMRAGKGVSAVPTVYRHGGHASAFAR
jgi:hypothetical protein